MEIIRFEKKLTKQTNKPYFFQNVSFPEMTRFVENQNKKLLKKNDQII